MRSISWMLVGLMALGLGCGGTGNAGDDGAAAEVADADASPLLLGHVSEGLAARYEGTTLIVRVNGADHHAAVNDDLTFAVRALPTGDVTIEVEVDGARGTVTLEDVEPGEVIEVFVDGGDGGIEIRVTRRDRVAEPDRVRPLPVNDSPIEIRDSDVIRRLGRGIYHGSISILGNNVTLIGASDGTCDDDERTYVDGPLEIRGNNARLVNIVFRGPEEIQGNNARFFDECVD